MLEPNAPYAVLSYPYAHADDTWLKRSLLSWDRVHVIRPAGVEDGARPPSAVESRIRERLPGFFNAVTPDDMELVPINDALHDLLEDPEVARRYGPEARNALARPGTPRSQAAPPDADPRLVWIYADKYNSKMSYVISSRLRQFQLADIYEHSGRRGEWLGLHPQFAAVYMTALATQIAQNRALTPYTEDKNVHRAAGSGDLRDLDFRLTGGTLSHPGRGESGLRVVEERYLHFALSAGIEPLNLDQVSSEVLIDFRESHADELRAFRRHLGALEGRLRALASVGETYLEQSFRELYNDETAPLLLGVRKGLANVGVKSVVRSLAIKFSPDALQGTALYMITDKVMSVAGAGESAGTIAAVAAGTLPLLAGLHHERQTLREPVAYLLEARNDLRPDAFLRDVLAN